MVQTLEAPTQLFENKNVAIVGTQWGDEGKGKGSNSSNAEMCARGTGADNAGHTYVANGVEINTHLLPSMISDPNALCVIGHGTFVNPIALMKEVEQANQNGIAVGPDNLRVGQLCHITLPKHVKLDELRETGSSKRGSTKKGVAFVAADMMLHEGIRGVSLLNRSNKDLHELAYSGLRGWVVTEHHEDHAVTRQIVPSKEEATGHAERFVKAVEFLRPYLCDTVKLVQDNLKAGQHITLEGAQAFGLDMRRGTYPNVTSSDTLVNGLASGTGMTHKQIDVALGVAKALPTVVGGDAMITMEHDPERVTIMRGKRGDVDGEFGKQTGRPRDPGYLDLVMLKAAAEANGLDGIVLNKLDVLVRCDWGIDVAVAYELDGNVITEIPADIDDYRRSKPIYRRFNAFDRDISGETRFENLPKTLQDLVKFSEEYVGVPFLILGTGPENHQAIVRKDLLAA